jgi:hypothetical protein
MPVVFGKFVEADRGTSSADRRSMRYITAGPELFVRERIRMDDGVCFCMGQIEAAPQHGTEFLIKYHSDATEDRSAEPRSIQCLRARPDIVALLHLSSVTCAQAF